MVREFGDEFAARNDCGKRVTVTHWLAHRDDIGRYRRLSEAPEMRSRTAETGLHFVGNEQCPSGLHRFRDLLHRPYLRAAVVALALVACVGAAGTVALEMRYGVPGEAVVRYFGRLHADADDLRPLLRQPTTLAALQELSYVSAGMNRGGLVYCDETGLSFYPWMPAGAALDGDPRHGEHLVIYQRLLAKYLDAELDGLLAELSHPETRRGLGRLGISPVAVAELRRRAAADPPPAERVLLLRRAG